MRYILLSLAVVAIVGIGIFLFIYSADGKRASAITEANAPAGIPVPQDDGKVAYKNASLHFSLRYPKELGQLTVYDEDADHGRTIAFQDSAGDKAFQIFVVPYTGSQISAERFKKDEPSGVRLEPTDITIDGVQAVKFFSKNDAMGETREIWFLHGGYLYEVTTYKDLDPMLLDIMTTWHFL